jgi:hypothetical protein
MEQFVSGVSLGDWWNNGSTNLSLTLKTYSFLARCNIPARLGRLDARKWETTIHDMLKDIQSVGVDAVDDYFDSIDSKLTFFEVVQSIPLLELAIWKSKIMTEQKGLITDNLSAVMKLQCRDNCGACVIIPSVLSLFSED